jgi:type II secretory pathway pseudopilin PulG
MESTEKQRYRDLAQAYPATDRRWTVLVFGRHGKVFAFKHLQALVVLVALVIVITLSAAAALLVLNLKGIEEKRRLQDALDLSLNQIKSLRHEKEILMARMVLAESRTKDNAANIAESAQPAASSSAEANSTNHRTDNHQTPRAAQPSTEISEDRTSAAGETETQAAEESEATPGTVAVENFRVTYEPAQKRYQAAFKLKNTTGANRRISGRAAVVLKGDDPNADTWLTMPTVEIVDGRPAGRIRGQAFAINYHKIMEFEKVSSAAPEAFHQATVFVFSSSADLLLEEDFTINLSEANTSQ